MQSIKSCPNDITLYELNKTDLNKCMLETKRINLTVFVGVFNIIILS